jgi:hypothetical protein
MIAYDTGDATMTIAGEASRLRIVSASKGFCDVTGAQPVLGMLRTDADSQALAITHRVFVHLFHSGVIVDLDATEPGAYRVLRVDPPPQVITPMTLSDSIAPRRFTLPLLGTFAIVALVLAALGVYGVVAYAVAERTREIGIRMALGAPRWSVVRMMVTQGLWSVGAGLVAGLFGAWAATRLIAGLLYGVQPHDAATFAVTALTLGSIACLACVVPGLKAALVDPVAALRSE